MPESCQVPARHPPLPACTCSNNDNLEPGSSLPSAILDCRTLGQELRAAGVWAA